MKKNADGIMVLTFLITIFAAFFADFANAASVKLSWNTPTTRTNGAPLARADIAKYEIRFAQQGGQKKTGTKTAKANTNGYSLPLPYPGYYLFTIRTVDTAGRIGPWSQGVFKNVP